MPIALIWSALFSVMERNFFGSDKASTISEKKIGELLILCFIENIQENSADQLFIILDPHYAFC